MKGENKTTNTIISSILSDRTMQEWKVKRKDLVVCIIYASHVGRERGGNTDGVKKGK